MSKEQIDWRPFRDILRRARFCAVMGEIEWDGSADIVKASREHLYKRYPGLVEKYVDRVKSNGDFDGALDQVIDEYINTIMSNTKIKIPRIIWTLFVYDTLRVGEEFTTIDRSPFRDCELQSEPPREAEFLVGLFAKKRYRNAILRDLAEDFDRDLASGMSLDHAKRRYWAAALNSLGPQALAAIKRIGIVGFVFDYARRWMG
jgi:hypothetical protein